MQKSNIYFVFPKKISKLAPEKTITTRFYKLKNLSTMEKLIAAIKAQVNAILADIDKVENKAAKARVRKATILLEKAAKEYRKVSVK